MNEMQVFKNEEFGQVRTVTIDGEPWFVGKDVAEALGYERTADAIKDHVDAEDKRHVKVGEIPTLKTGNFGASIINESGLYSLIFGSKLESAKRFKRWVTSEVLPAIRKTGHYEAKPAEPQPVPADPLPKAQSVSEVVSLGKFVRDIVRDQGASPYQTAELLLDTMKDFGVKMSGKLLLPVKLDKVREDELDMVEFKLAYPDSTWNDYMMYRTLMKVSR